MSTDTIATARASTRPWAVRAAAAEFGVTARHLRRVLGLPGTRLGVSAWPATFRQRAHADWTYRWQVYLLEGLLDAQQREPMPARRLLIRQLMRGLRLRNGLMWATWRNDDLAVAGLALLRVSMELGISVNRTLNGLVARLRVDWTDHAGGGVWWRRDDNLKNVATNGAAATLLARVAATSGARVDLQRARAMAEWLEDNLFDRGSGLLMTGLRVRRDGTAGGLVREIRGYCQAVFLGACLELAAAGDPVWAERAERTIFGVAAYLADDGVLRDGEEGGLFAGVLARYLARAALRLPALGGSRDAAELAAWLVFASAEAAWCNRAVVFSGPLFGAEWGRPALVPSSLANPGRDQALAGQLGGWLVLEAAALLEWSR